MVSELLQLSGTVGERIDRYVALLQRWNKTYRLIGPDDLTTIADKHIADSLALLPHLDAVQHIVDLGAGAGLPGIPLQIMRPELRVTLVEAQRKRVNFCDQVRRELSLTNLRVVYGRVEDPQIISTVGTADLVVSRATWKLGQFLEYARPYLTQGGRVIAMKGPQWEMEAVEIAPPDRVDSYSLPISNAPRFFVTYFLSRSA